MLADAVGRQITPRARTAQEQLPGGSSRSGPIPFLAQGNAKPPSPVLPCVLFLPPLRFVLCIALFVLASASVAMDGPVATFTENKGQWPTNVLYRTRFPGGELFVEKNRFTYVLHQGGPMQGHGHAHDEPPEPFRAHAYQVIFSGAQLAHGEGRSAQPHYENFFLGNDPASWGTGCRVFGEVVLRGLYPGVDLRIDGSKGLKYEFIVAAGVDPSIIQMRYEGQDDIAVRDERLLVRTSCGTIAEEAPKAWDERGIVPVSYQLNGMSVRFRLPNEHAGVLVLDPELTFGSYTGSTADNLGFTATYDNDGALYGGGIVFGGGYPATTGVLDNSFSGGNIDIGISKWSPDGNTLQWSTYIGGSDNETPHSLVVNDNDELFVLAVTGSFDFPVTPGSFDGSFNGGTLIPVNNGFVNLLGGEGYGFANGTDIAVMRLSPDASTLLASTYVGGSGNDGLNQSTALAYNYGDHFRGEIALDAQERPVVATSTQSTNMPVAPGAPQPAYGGGDLDGFLFRLDPDLTALQLATYRGGAQGDSGYGVQFSSTGDIYLTGGTASAGLTMAGSPTQNSFGGGVDGHIARYADNGQLLSSTFVGTASTDQCYFVQLDTDDDVYVVGQTHGSYPVTPGKYVNPGSSQFIHKFSPDLSTSIWSTRIGNGNGTEDISPSAFLVSNCGQIYFSGWGGSVNSNMLAAQSTTIGLPVTSDAYQSTTDGSDFYLMVLDPEASGLAYATFFGGATSMEHVDGGTSRFDKDGNVYQAVCAGCGGHDDFPTTPGAWSQTNNSFNCNLGVFKFNLGQPVAQIGIDGPGYVCFPGSAQFTNNSIGGTSQVWDFGDGASSTDFAPEHTWDEPGTYTVYMVLSDSTSCLPNDTASITVDVIVPDTASIDPVGTVCVGQSVQLHAHGGDTYQWSPTTGLSDPTSPDPTATPSGAITYTVTATDACGSSSASIDIIVGEASGSAGADMDACLGVPATLSATGGTTYLWSPAASLDDPTLPTPLATPSDTTSYVVVITSGDGCETQDTLVVNVVFGPPEPTVEDTAVCLGAGVQLTAYGGSSYQWAPGPGITDPTSASPMVSPTEDMYYIVFITNVCGTTDDSAFVDVQQVIADAWPDTLVCPGEPVTLFASGGLAYLWAPSTALSNADSAVTVATPDTPTTYTVTASNALGCEGSAMVTISHFPQPQVHASNDVRIDFGHSTVLTASGTGVLLWTPGLSLSCDTCATTIASPEHTTVYTVQLTDANGCKAADQVTVFVNGNLYVPNTFTPNGDGINDGFFAYATEISEFRLLVFNRWGEQIYRTNKLGPVWDGTYNGVESPIDTYVWRVDLEELSGNKRTVYGHVNLVR